MRLKEDTRMAAREHAESCGGMDLVKRCCTLKHPVLAVIICVNAVNFIHLVFGGLH